MGDILGEQPLWLETDPGNQSRYIGTIRHHIAVQNGHKMTFRFLTVYVLDSVEKDHQLHGELVTDVAGASGDIAIAVASALQG